MIILKDINKLIIPKVDRCKKDPCNLYQLIWQNKGTKEIEVFKVRDYASISPVYYVFNFRLPEWFEFGEYDLYLVKNWNWSPYKVNEDNIYNTQKHTLKTPVNTNGVLIVSGGKLLVTNRFKARLSDACNNSLLSNGSTIIAYSSSDDKRAQGEIWTYLDIIHTDLAMYKAIQHFKDTYIEPTRGSKREYKERKRL